MLVDVDHDMACMREETFGPTLPIMKVADAEEAILLANDSEYGLCAAVFSRDLARAEAVARRVNAGAVTINDALVNYTALELPMGGANRLGRRLPPRPGRNSQVLPPAVAADLAAQPAARSTHASLYRLAEPAIRLPATTRESGLTTRQCDCDDPTKKGPLICHPYSGAAGNRTRCKNRAELRKRWISVRETARTYVTRRADGNPYRGPD